MKRRIEAKASASERDPSSKEDFDTIRKLLPKLSAQRIQDLRLLLDTYYAPEAATNHDASDWLLSGIQDEMRRRGLGCPPLTAKFVSKDVFAQAAAVKEILTKSARRSGSSLSTTQWLALGKVCAEALATLILSWKVEDETTQEWKPVPFSVRVMLNNIAKVPEALEADFPGYLEAGLLHLLVRVRDPDDRPADADLPPDDAPYAPPGKEHLDEFAEADEEDWRRRQEAWNERHKAQREAEAELARSFNKKLGHDPPPPPPPPPSPPDDDQYQYAEGEDEGPQDDED